MCGKRQREQTRKNRCVLVPRSNEVMNTHRQSLYIIYTTHKPSVCIRHTLNHSARDRGLAAANILYIQWRDYYLITTLYSFACFLCELLLLLFIRFFAGRAKKIIVANDFAALFTLWSVYVLCIHVFINRNWCVRKIAEWFGVRWL